MVVNNIDARPFAVDAFKRQLTEASRSKLPERVIAQVAYLARYCSWLEAKTVVSEDHYIDRHFLDEHALYYSRNLQPPPNFVRRFHLFSRSISDKQLGKLFEKRASPAKSDENARGLERSLSKDAPHGRAPDDDGGFNARGLRDRLVNWEVHNAGTSLPVRHLGRGLGVRRGEPGSSHRVCLYANPGLRRSRRCRCRHHQAISLAACGAAETPLAGHGRVRTVDRTARSSGETRLCAS